MKTTLPLLALVALAPIAASALAQNEAVRIETVTLGELRPTQPALGYRQMDYKQGRFAQDREKLFDEYCETAGQSEIARFDDASTLEDLASFDCVDAPGSHPEDMKTAVIAPGGEFYLTDGHHTFSNFITLQGDAFRMPVLITDDYSDLADRQTFWNTLQAERQVWLESPSGPITVDELPKRLGRAHQVDDAYRSLVYFTRGVGYDKPETPPPFLEFYWGQWLEERMALANFDLESLDGYAEAVEHAARLMVNAPADTVIAETASGPLTAEQMGRLDAFDQPALDKLLSPRGKLTYAFFTE
ncbi:ParB/Srx family N-terminal domain-containing protein [Halomonas sp. PAMB 3264]|uniref:ParB/Srx family N-terminal domain-containing protein n=1 Tax=unclassified Halomonas TaxID=2609666 RepID=UPI00289CEA9A|nr:MULTISPECIES: ParB/Srx family N-terminal domain-containing protein [unclassified Halomonas]WNL40259.1 ParB/Srx family N-terminal domain-containing protein [Halomonas sp. PAMB 3232]WNL43590.1 ParB/Srx family N-terminal domain-containing protein [Halomonas sp. PAMB 3264]